MSNIKLFTIIYIINYNYNGDKMKKILPFDCNPIVKTYPYFADYLGALKANGYEIDNILEHYFICINYIPFTGQVNFQHKASLRNSLKYHKYDVESIDIIDFVKTNIIKNNYITIVLNDNHFETKQKMGVHNWLLYGFDDEQETIYIAGYVAYENCAIYKSLTITFTELKNSIVKKLTKIEKRRISTNHIFKIPENINLCAINNYGYIKKLNFYFISLHVFKLLIFHNFIYAHLNFTPYKRDFLDLRDLRIIYEQSVVLKKVLSKRTCNSFDKELTELTELSKAILIEASIFHNNPNKSRKVKCAKSINRKIYKIYKIEKSLSKYIFK